MASFVLTLSLTAGVNAPDCCWGWGYGGWYYPAYYYPVYYPAYSYYPWWGWYPGYSCASVIVAEPSGSQEKSKDDKSKKENGKEKSDKKDKGKKDSDLKVNLGERALLLVELPADAKLFIDGKQMKSGTPRLRIITPDLSPGQTYAYDVRVELNRNGRTVAETQEVRFRSGQRITASFGNLESRATLASDTRP